MNKNLLSYGILAVFIVLNLYLLWKQSVISKQLKISTEYTGFQKSSYENIIGNLKSQINLNLSSTVKLPKCITSDLSNEETLVLYIQDGVCWSCVQEIMNYLQNSINLIGANRLLILTNFYSDAAFKEFVHNEHIQIYKSINCTDFNLAPGLEKQPIVFIISKNKEIKLVYIPNYFPEYKQTYFDKIIPTYFLTNMQ